MIYRPRRLRRTDALRSMVRETRLTRDDFVLPLFVCPGSGVRREISSMPGVFNLSIDETTKEVAAAYDAGVRSIILFGLPESKDELASGAYAEDGIVQRAIRAIRQSSPDVLIMADTCLCEYTSHGHCGVVRGHEVLNDESLDLLARTAVSQAAAGADLVGPSAMMDGQVGAIREALDESGFENVAIMSYAVKYASGLYGPFREAAQSAPEFGDRRAYQMDPPNVREAMREAELDAAEGADILMVKPATIYLDVLRMVRERFDLPTAAYHVSGEYALIKAAAQKGWIDEQRVMLETLTSIKRAGADIILTYYAREAIRALEQIK
ncbi:MAG TPA: porphobilinogen synthase [Pyrinomonadaceae bacterium]|nr:porphobilinogen synthase [Pyrinomonadaceae bacterium]